MVICRGAICAAARRNRSVRRSLTTRLREYRFQWNSPLMISPHDPKTIYYGGNHLFKSVDRGDTWEVLGEDLTSGADRNKQTIFGLAVDQHTLSRNDGVVWHGRALPLLPNRL